MKTPKAMKVKAIFKATPPITARSATREDQPRCEMTNAENRFDFRLLRFGDAILRSRLERPWKTHLAISPAMGRPSKARLCDVPAETCDEVAHFQTL